MFCCSSCLSCIRIFFFNCFFLLFFEKSGSFFSSSASLEKKKKNSCYGALKAKKVNMRKGPGSSYDVLCYVSLQPYQRWPILIIRQKNHWYLVRDYEGTLGWVNGAMISFGPWFLTLGDRLPLYKNYEQKEIIAYIERFSCVYILKEKEGYYYVSVHSHKKKGWIAKGSLWPQ